ncbi:hypothetical protein KKC32_04925 [Patescibacteria group bacterium]|nr:hypothetical protein [Patescibacteria group bacterium]
MDYPSVKEGRKLENWVKKDGARHNDGWSGATYFFVVGNKRIFEEGMQLLILSFMEAKQRGGLNLYIEDAESALLLIDTMQKHGEHISDTLQEFDLYLRNTLNPAAEKAQIQRLCYLILTQLFQLSLMTKEEEDDAKNRNKPSQKNEDAEEKNLKLIMKKAEILGRYFSKNFSILRKALEMNR